MHTVFWQSSFFCSLWDIWVIYEPPHDKTSKMACAPSKDSDQPGPVSRDIAMFGINWKVILPVWSESALSTWRKLGSLATHWAHSEDSDQTGRMPRLNWIFAGSTVILLVLSWGGSVITMQQIKSRAINLTIWCLEKKGVYCFYFFIWYFVMYDIFIQGNNVYDLTGMLLVVPSPYHS